MTPPEIGHANIEYARTLAADGADRLADDVIETMGITRASGTSFDRALGGRKPVPDSVRDILHGTGYGFVVGRADITIAEVARG